jgi:hypothetical protein
VVQLLQNIELLDKLLFEFGVGKYILFEDLDGPDLLGSLVLALVDLSESALSQLLFEGVVIFNILLFCPHELLPGDIDVRHRVDVAEDIVQGCLLGVAVILLLFVPG